MIKTNAKFCTVINCMDGRVQLPVIQYMKNKFNVNYVDSITEPGPNLILAKGKNNNVIKSILNRVKISVEKHDSAAIAVVGHYDCAGNPASKQKQIVHIKKSIAFLNNHYKNIKIIGIWVNKNWETKEVA